MLDEEYQEVLDKFTEILTLIKAMIDKLIETFAPAFS